MCNLSETGDQKWFKWYVVNTILLLGEPNYLLDKTILTEARGQVYKAVWFRGVLHCSIYGHITNITVYKIPLTEITVRDENGSRIIDYDDKFYSSKLELYILSGKFTNSLNINASN